jgi:hypothetical protein
MCLHIVNFMGGGGEDADDRQERPAGIGGRLPFMERGLRTSFVNLNDFKLLGPHKLA